MIQVSKSIELFPLTTLPYKAPRSTIPPTATFDLMSNCKRQRLKNGRARIAASTVILGIAMLRKYFFRLMHCGSGIISGCQKPETGLQAKTATRMVDIPHPIVMAPSTYVAMENFFPGNSSLQSSKIDILTIVSVVAHITSAMSVVCRSISPDLETLWDCGPAEGLLNCIWGLLEQPQDVFPVPLEPLCSVSSKLAWDRLGELIPASTIVETPVEPRKPAIIR